MGEKRILEYTEQSSVDNTDYMLTDSGTKGSKKYQVSRILTEAEAVAQTKVDAEAAAREAADNELKADLTGLISEYAEATPITYTINQNRVNILDAFYTIENGYMRRVILLKITTNSITSANTWTLGTLTPFANLKAGESYIDFDAKSITGEDISGMTFRQNAGSSSNFMLITTGAVTQGQGGIILLTNSQPINVTSSIYPDTSYPQKLIDDTMVSKDLFNSDFVSANYAWRVSSETVQSLSGYSYIRIRVEGGSSIAVHGLTESLSSYGYGIQDETGTTLVSSGESIGMIIDIPDNGYWLIFTFPNSNNIKLIPYFKKKVVVLGDSWSDNDPEHTTYTKWTTLLQRDGRYNVKVYAQNGSSISGDTPNYGLNGNVAGQIEQLKADNILNVDYVIIFGGINDFRGTISNPYVYNKVAEFYTSLNQMYPNARIIYISNNQIFITQQQLDYFHQIIDYLRTVVGMEAYTTFGWVSPAHYLSDHVHVDDSGYRDLFANILSILNGGCVETVKTTAQLNDGTTASQIYETWVNGYPKYAIKTTVSSTTLGGTTEYNITADQGLLLASVPFAKRLNKAYPTSATMPTGMVKCDIAETFTTTSRLNLENTFVIYHASANSGAYITDNYN